MALAENRRDRILVFAGIAVVALMGSLAVAHAADPFPWGFSDSVEYVVSARNLLRGDGLGMWTASGRFAPMSEKPPLYSLILAAGGMSGADLLSVARWVNLLVIALAIFASGAIVWNSTGSALISIGVALLVASSPQFLLYSSAAMSELLFVGLALASLGLAIAATRSASRAPFVLSALAASLAALTRYVGVGVIIAGGLTIALLGAGSWKGRLARFGAYLAIALAPLGIWAALERLAQGGELPRGLQSDLGNLWVALRPFRGDLATWGWYLVPTSVWFPAAPWWSRLIVMGVLILLPIGGVAYAAARDPRWRTKPHLAGSLRLTTAATIFLASYLGALALSYLLVDPRPDINERMLLPLQIPVWLALTGTILLAGSLFGSRRWAAVGVTVAVMALVVSQADRGWSTVQDLHAEHRGYTASGWRDSALLDYLRDLPASTRIVTNESALVLLWTDRPAYDLPEALPDATPKAAFLPFGEDPTDPLEVQFRETDTVLALFQTILPQLQRVYGEEAPSRLNSMLAGLKVEYAGAEGTIYSYPE